MTDTKDKPSDRQISQRQARDTADAARATRQSDQPGVDDDSEIVQSLVATLGAPVEGAMDAMREREHQPARDPDAGPNPGAGISGERAQDTSNVDADAAPRAKVPTRPEDAEAEPADIAEEMTRDHPGARGRR